MNTYVGQHVKCFLRNSAVVEGIVIEWDKTIELQSLDRKSILIIHHPDEDIILTKMLLSEETHQNVQSLEQAFKKLPTTEEVAEDEKLDPMTLQAKSAAELRIELAKQERKILVEKLKDHHLGQTQRVEYGQPKFIKKAQ
jgi:hypothetical protein